MLKRWFKHAQTLSTIKLIEIIEPTFKNHPKINQTLLVSWLILLNWKSIAMIKEHWHKGNLWIEISRNILFFITKWRVLWNFHTFEKTNLFLLNNTIQKCIMMLVISHFNAIIWRDSWLHPWMLLPNCLPPSASGNLLCHTIKC